MVWTLEIEFILHDYLRESRLGLGMVQEKHEGEGSWFLFSKSQGGYLLLVSKPFL